MKVSDKITSADDDELIRDHYGLAQGKCRICCRCCSKYRYEKGFSILPPHLCGRSRTNNVSIFVFKRQEGAVLLSEGNHAPLHVHGCSPLGALCPTCTPHISRCGPHVCNCTCSTGWLSILAHFRFMSLFLTLFPFPLPFSSLLLKKRLMQ